jgi:prepilin-type N-terminal cleavage/methylation domain-containing protein
MQPRRAQGERGFTLVEMLVTVVIIGIAFATLVGGIGAAVLTSDHHRQQGTVNARLRNFVETLKAATPYVNCATPAKYTASVSPVRVGVNATTSATTHSTGAQSVSNPRSRLVSFFGLTGATSGSAPASMSRFWDVASTPSDPALAATATAMDEALSAAGGVTRSATTAAATNATVQSLVLEPSSETVPVARKSVATAFTSGATTLTLARPATASTNDLLFAQIVVRNVTVVVTPPDGWLLISQAQSGSVRSFVYQLVQTASTPANLVWTFSANVPSSGGIAAFSGVQPRFVSTVTSVRYWNGTQFVGTCPSSDLGLQSVTVSVTDTNRQITQGVDFVKRRS